MKKLLLILICLFVSFEVKSEKKKDKFYYMTDYDVPVSKCVKYLEKGKVLHSWESRIVFSTSDTDSFDKSIVFAYKGKVYELIVRTEKDKGNPDNSKIFMGEVLERMWCHSYDFDKE